MPKGKTHMMVGAGAGLISLAAIPPERPTESLAVLLGRITGGLVGGCIPDWLEPATSPRHRQSAHSFIAGGSVYGLCAAAHKAETYCLDWAVELSKRAEVETDAVKRTFLLLTASTLRFIGSFLVGGAVGYVSHLVLDLFTPAGLPLI